MKKYFIFSAAIITFLTGCTMTEQANYTYPEHCIPPDKERAEMAFQYVLPYSEALWHKHYNRDKNKIPPYTLPQFTSKSVKDWEEVERPRILQQVKDCFYGEMPPATDFLDVELLTQVNDALEGTAILKEFRIHCRMKNGKKFHFDTMLFVPKNAKTPPPVFVGLNFSGNHTYTKEPSIRISRGMEINTLERKFYPLSRHQRGKFDNHTWNFREAIKRGYAVAIACYWEVCPDWWTGIKISPFTLFYDEKDLRMDYEVPYQEAKAGKWTRPVGTIGAWAWGMSRILDALEKEPLVDANRAAVIGHSRLGKTALFAGACDQRFKLVISNNSGNGGAKLSRRKFGETMPISYWEQRMWYCGKLAWYIEKEQTLPFDQHMFLALIAPRALCVASATEDLNADPEGEFLATYHAEPIWQLYGQKGLGSDKMPDTPQTLGSEKLFYNLRAGKHAVTAKDWECYYNIADKVFNMK